MKRVSLLVISFILLFISCTNNDFDNIISNEYEKCLENNDRSCAVDLSVILKFEWDTMYYFSGANSLEDINSPHAGAGILPVQ